MRVRSGIAAVALALLSIAMAKDAATIHSLRLDGVLKQQKQQEQKNNQNQQDRKAQQNQQSRQDQESRQDQQREQKKKKQQENQERQEQLKQEKQASRQRQQNSQEQQNQQEQEEQQDQQEQENQNEQNANNQQSGNDQQSQNNVETKKFKIGNVRAVFQVPINEIQTGKEGLEGEDAKPGQTTSEQSNINFFDACVGKNVMDGQQQKEDQTSCNTTPMGEVPAVSNMPTVSITSPQMCEDIQEGEAFKVVANYKNIALGSFTDPKSTFYDAPTRLTEQGEVIGHTHIACQLMSANSFNPENPPDAEKPDFFKGIDDPGETENGITTVEATVEAGEAVDNKAEVDNKKSKVEVEKEEVDNKKSKVEVEKEEVEKEEVEKEEVEKEEVEKEEVEKEEVEKEEVEKEEVEKSKMEKAKVVKPQSKLEALIKRMNGTEPSKPAVV
ncbi:hypothetical protein G6O67_007885 [Ophiocordyceps sinensis]|uniref:Uncharacterized protein n=1 Tax=Ophiocordyceps sinensis TaxID=72228 RepID=A0A8H4LSC6_9HYPO|nr:hypothetical protein G6O67_007885 [Ophiocordyceps sinensis]